MGGKTVSSSTPANQDSDIKLVASIGEIYGDSDYVELTKKPPTILASTLDIAGQINELE